MSFDNKKYMSDRYRKRREQGLCGHCGVRSTGSPCVSCVANKKTRESGSLEYQSWVATKRRCDEPTSASYSRYGAVGISYCARWKIYANFLEDMGRRPSPKHSLDRKNNDGDYEPDNCRWATAGEQARNRRTTKLNEKIVLQIFRASAQGERNKDIAERFDVADSTICMVLRGRRWAT